MKPETQQKLERLSHLAHAAQNKKIVLEEIRTVAAEAFDLQDKLMAELDASEAVETDIKTVQELFEVRELVWDTINRIALREKEIKEAHTSRAAFQAHQKKTKDIHETHECACGCCHQNEEKNNEVCHDTSYDEHSCCCHHHEEHRCCHEDEETAHTCCHGGKKHCCHTKH